ncbi:ABC transporter permease [Streptomyces nitrosporeus]|uniref:ABC transporter permease n=1 Tax=Streptomyces nitrosporeus TaxID=28894 RepID=A0A5J6FB57_9ACTN|nr:ABC transporter permease [Streptomyces nitrosporeus]QEU73296.1 ABC transporter permease [Streptomyces nitrosporeus]GGZ09147.1 ABC transporter permease [Streptomyces nitrosporeus]
MSTSPTATPALTAPAPAVHRLSTAGILHSEWHKLRSLRSTWITLGTAASLVLGIGLVMGGTYTSGGGDSDIDTVVLVLYGTLLGQLCVTVLGILVTAGEYSTGMIRTSLTVVPRRLPVLWAKAAVFTVTAFVWMTVTALVTFLAAQALLAGTDQAAALTDSGVLRAIAGNSAGITLLGLTALGLGASLRSVPGAVGAYIGGVLLLPEVLGMLPYDAVESALVYFPTQAAGALGSATPIPGAASAGPALLALCLWAGASLAVAAVLVRRRDV